MAEEVKQSAIDIAMSCGHDVLQLEHMLTALCSCEEAKTIILLHEAGMDVKKFSDWMTESYFSDRGATDAIPEVGPMVEEVFAHAAKFAEESGEGDEWISVDHMFVGVISLSDHLEPMVLDRLDFDYKKFEEDLAKYLKGETFIEQGERGGDMAKPIPSGRTANLQKYGTNLNDKCEGDEFDFLFRDSELAKMEFILNRKNKNNVLITGESGTGKTSIVECLAHRIANNKCSHYLANKVIFSLSLTSMVSGSKHRGDFEEKLEAIIREAKDPSVILFLDEIHTIIGAGDSEGGLDAANILKPYLSNGDITIIGSTTYSEYRGKISKDKALDRRFDIVKVKEPSESDVLGMLKSKMASFEDYHTVKIGEKNLQTIVGLSSTYMKSFRFPDKAFDLLDLACSHCKIKKVKKPKKLIEEESDLIKILLDEEADKDIQSERLLQYRDSYENWIKKTKKNKVSLKEEDIIEVLSQKLDIPKDKFSRDGSEKYINLASRIKKRVFGQDVAVNKICKSLIRYKSGLRDESKPIGSFLCLGSTGVGKTHLAKIIAKEAFAGNDNFIRLDMSEYSESHSVSKLVGSPPGYSGHERGGALVEKVYNNPHCVVLFDEIEKSHEDVQRVLLQILEDGKLTDSIGREACFNNCIVAITGNIASDLLVKTQALGFGGNIGEKERKDSAFTALKKKMPLELINRFDDVIFFENLKEDDFKNIITSELSILSRHKDVRISFDKSVSDFVYQENKENEFGARQIKRFIQREVLDPLSLYLLRNSKRKNIKVSFDFDKKEILMP